MLGAEDSCFCHNATNFEANIEKEEEQVREELRENMREGKDMSTIYTMISYYGRRRKEKQSIEKRKYG